MLIPLAWFKNRSPSCAPPPPGLWPRRLPSAAFEDTVDMVSLQRLWPEDLKGRRELKVGGRDVRGDRSAVNARDGRTLRGAEGVLDLADLVFSSIARIWECHQSLTQET